MCFVYVYLSACVGLFVSVFFFFFKQKTAYEMRISDWSSDVCSSDLLRRERRRPVRGDRIGRRHPPPGPPRRHHRVDEPGRHCLCLPCLTRTASFARQADASPLKSSEIGRASCGKECVSSCRFRWLPEH